MMKHSSIEKRNFQLNWFYKTILRKRLLSATGCFILSTPLTFVFIILISQIQIFSLSYLFKDFLGKIFLWRTWSYISICTLVIVVTSFWRTLCFSNSSIKRPTLISYISSYLRLVNICLYLSHIFVGALWLWCYSQFIPERYKYLSQTSENRLFVNHLHLILVFNGMFIGFTFSSKFALSNDPFYTFSFIEQSKFYRVKFELMKILKSSFYQVIKSVFYVYLFYILIVDGVLIQWLCFCLNLENQTVSLFNIFVKFLDFELLFHTVVSGTHLYYMLLLFKHLNNVYQTERYVFPIEVALEQNQDNCLMNSLCNNNNQLLQNLAFYDLHMLSKHDVSRRSQVFSLSLPGGHPHNWSSILDSCLTIIHNFYEDLSHYTNIVYFSNSQNSNQKLNKATTSFENLSFSGKKTSQFEHQENYALINKPSFFEKLSLFIKNHRALAFLFKEFPGIWCDQIFSQSHLVVWSVEALSMLAAASYKEDKYGVVQKSLPNIIESFVLLLELLDKHSKRTASYTRVSAAFSSSNSHNLRFGIRSSLECSIYRIVATFGNNLCHVGLSPEQKRKIQQFIEFKE